MDYQRVIDRLDAWIVDRPKQVILVFLVLTVVLAVGLASVSTEAGTEQFAEEVPEQDALDAINEEFEPPFVPGTGTTQLIQTGENVLSERGLVRMLTIQRELEKRPGLRVTGVSSAASRVALTLDPEATTPEQQIIAVEQASPGEIAAAVRRTAAQDPGFATLLSNDFNPRAGSATSTIAVVEHAVPGLSETAQEGETDPLTPIQQRIQRITDAAGGDVRVFGSGIINEEFSNVIGDTLIIVIPAAALLIVFFLIIAYRDLVDLILGIVALAMTIVWTLGLMGWVGIPFNQILIAVPPLLLAVGIDFGIHAVNRYREERAAGLGIGPAMRLTTDQLLVAFFIVTTTSVIGFAANVTSQLLPIRDFGIVASIGIVFTFAIFGVFLPAAKVSVDRLRERYPIPTFSQSPLGSEGSSLGRALQGGVVIARRAPVVFLVFVFALSLASGVYATGLDTTFSDENFLPPEETPEYLADLPEPFKPNEYTVTRDINFLEATFETSEDERVTIYVEGPMERDDALEAIYRAGDDPPETFIVDDRHAREESIITVIQARASGDADFRRLVERNDRDRNGIPDDNLDAIYDALLSSPARETALNYLTEDRRSTRVIYSVEGDADQGAVTADGREVADRYRMQATATGNIVVFQAIADLILRSALVSLGVALTGTAIFLILVYGALEGRPSLGLANLVPIVVTVLLLAGTMRLVGLALNAFTATVLAITIGLGIDYSVHVVHRFIDEFDECGDAMLALSRTVIGTGGALTGSMLTTVFGIGVLVLSIFPAIGQFGLLTGLSVVYAYLSSLFVLPSTLVVWDRLANRRSAEAAERAEPRGTTD